MEVGACGGRMRCVVRVLWKVGRNIVKCCINDCKDGYKCCDVV